MGKFLSVLGKVLAKGWKFAERSVTIVFLAVFVLLVLTVLMPDNAIKAVDLIKSLFG